MSDTDVWAVSPAAASATLIFPAAAVAGAGALALSVTQPEDNGCGYKLLFTSVGNSSAMSYTVVGEKVGQINGITTEVVAGPNATTATTTNYWARIISVTASAAAVGNQSIGITGSLALPRTRIRAVHYVGAAAAGSIIVTMAGTSKVILTVDTPTGVATCGQFDTISIPVRSSVADDYAVVALTQVTKCTFICG